MTKSRRERLREATINEIKETALNQISEGGKDALSMGAIARSMGMTTPALYRYFASRDELLSSLIQDSFTALNDHLNNAAQTKSSEAFGQHLNELFLEYRRWGLDNPQLFGLIFSPDAQPFRSREGHQEQLHQLLQTLSNPLEDAEHSGIWTPPCEQPSLALMEKWKKEPPVEPKDEEGYTPSQALAVTFLLWMRCHGLLSYEINQVFSTNTLDFGELYLQELNSQGKIFGIPEEELV